MKKILKEPKTFNKPRAYMRINGKKKIKNDFDIRIRIVYPDGKTEWANGDYSFYEMSTWFGLYPCWHGNYCTVGYETSSTPLMTAEEAIKAMKEYDKAEGFKTLYLGEF